MSAFAFGAKMPRTGRAVENIDLPPVPEAFICPITGKVMADPVTAADGHTYERHAIEIEMATGLSKSPVTGENFEHNRLMASRTIKNMISQWAETEHKKIMEHRENMERARNAKLASDTNLICEWLIHDGGIHQDTAGQIACQLVKHGATSIDGVVNLVESTSWNDIVLVEKRISTANIMYKQMVKDTVLLQALSKLC